MRPNAAWASRLLNNFEITKPLEALGWVFPTNSSPTRLEYPLDDRITRHFDDDVVDVCPELCMQFNVFRPVWYQALRQCFCLPKDIF